MADIIKVEHLSYVYNPGMPNAVTALDDVSFTVEEGDFVGIIGATGSGKSTLITHMNGLNKPTSGKIYIDGRDLWEDPEKIRDFRFLTGLVFQYPEYQLFEETCYKDIAFGPKNMGLDEAEIDRRVHEAADFVGLDPVLLERSPFELSGGQKRRVAVAGVMAMKPRILVLDEPAAGLDPEGRDDILSEVKEYHKKTGTTVLLVSHSMEDIAKYANRVLVMSNKKIAMYDTVEKVFARTLLYSSHPRQNADDQAGGPRCRAGQAGCAPGRYTLGRGRGHRQRQCGAGAGRPCGPGLRRGVRRGSL